MHMRTHHLQANPKFRNDINSLRAIAVLSVVLFHFKPNWLSGGFIGVDIFFVISGYLMSSIIFNQLNQQRFSLLNFYLSRANRIIPALGFVCMVLLVFAWFYLPPLDYLQLGKHVASSISFLSNFMYWHEAGYFDTASQEKWFLHTWSLSVEWQFYLIYPLILLLLHKLFSLAQLKKIFIILLLGLFGLNLYITQLSPSSSYFLLPARAWEMLLGGLVFLYPLQLKQRTQQYLQSCGLLLILISCFLINNKMPWPGYWALLPLIGGLLILTANLQDSIFSQNKILQALGRWSYSIYLWHWPLAVFGLYFNINHWWIFAIPCSILLGYFSYTYIEQLKLNRHLSWSTLLKNKPLWICIFTGSAGMAVFLSLGVSWHYKPQVVIASLEERNTTPYPCMQDENQDPGRLVRCSIGNPKRSKAIMVGDSHADALASGLYAAFNTQQDGIEVITRASCPFLLNAKHVYNNDTCYKENFRRLATLQQIKNTPIVITARWTSYFYGQTDPMRIRKGYEGATLYFGSQKKMGETQLLNAFAENLKLTLCSLPKDNPIFITQPVPEIGKNVPKTMSRLMMQNKPLTELNLSYQDYIRRNQRVREIIQKAANECHATVLDPAPWLCKDGQCIAQYQMRPLYSDGDHMSEYGNKFLTPMFAQIKTAR